MLENHFLFNVLDKEMEFSPYKLLILPDDIEVDESLKIKIDRYLSGGGKLLLTGHSGLNSDQTKCVFDIGGELSGTSEFEPDYVLPNEPLRPDFCDSPIVMYRRATRLKATVGQSLGDVYDPYFNRSYRHFCSHQHTPPRPEASGYHLGVTHGQVTYLAHPIFTLYAGYGSVAYRQLFSNVIDQILGEDRTLRTNLPSTARVTLTRQDAEDRYVLHLLYANTIRRGGVLELSGGTTRATQPIEIIDELIPLHDVEVELSKDLKVAEPDRKGVTLTTDADGSKRLRIDEFQCHEVICF
jgi:hypothetical protein